MGALKSDSESLLREVEDRLRAAGLTGAQAFAALVAAFEARLGDPVEVHPALAAISGFADRDPDFVGLAYERFFPDLFKAKRGQYFTPPPLIAFLLDLLQVQPGERVLDPTCGSGGFLVGAAQRGAQISGIELDPLLASLARLNLRIANVPGKITCADFFGAVPDPVEVVLANPPFSVDIDVPPTKDGVSRRSRRLSDHLFVERLPDWLVPNGRAAVILPWSFLANPAASTLRTNLRRRLALDRIIALPEGIFRSFGGAAGRAAVLMLRKGPPKTTLWGEIRNPGWDVRRKRFHALPGSDFPALLHSERWEPLPPESWSPARTARSGKPLAELADVARPRFRPGQEPTLSVGTVDLADVHADTGEILRAKTAEGRAVVGVKTKLSSDDILVSRLRPDLGTVGLAPQSTLPLCGSTEWILVRPKELRYFLWSALRSSGWREQLPQTRGQTRPRITASDVANSSVPWPGQPLAAALDRTLNSLVHERQRLGAALLALHNAIDQFSRGEIDEAELERRRDEVERHKGR